jgi:nucleoside-diphosphate-sugar epimerase
MKTLLLGGGGFVGRALTSALYKDRELFVATSQPNLEVPNGVRKLNMGFADLADLQSDSVLGEFASVIDCSWEGLPDRGESLNSRNLTSKLDLVSRLEKAGVREYNGFGSCLEYGSLLGAVNEDDKGTDVGDFALTKLKILEALRKTNLKYRWFRPFYLVGSRQHANSLFHSAYKDTSEGKDFIPKSDSSLAFDFVDISDFATGVRVALSTESVWGVINLGSGLTHSIEEVANEFRRHFGFDQRVSEKQNSMYASTAKLLSAADWKPQLGLSEMVEKFIREKHGV